jgi:hypothetical protein
MSSVAVHVLTTSEGRDKIFKTVQYLLKLAVWTLLQPNLLPAGTDTFRGQWSTRLRGNCQTVRNGRALFALGRWIPMVLDLAECLSSLKASLSAGTRQTRTTRLVLLLILCFRIGASVLRNVLRDFVHLCDKELFGFRHSMLPARASRNVQSLATLSWVVISSADLFLHSWRLSAGEWMPHGTVLRCDCMHREIDRIEFPQRDLVRCCPVARSAQFVSATAPSEMMLRCSECGVQKPVGEVQVWPKRTTTLKSPLVLLPTMVRRLRSALVVVSKHQNLQETMILVFKAVCDLTLAVSSAIAQRKTGARAGDRFSGYRNSLASLCGLVSALVAVRRVAIDAG